MEPRTIFSAFLGMKLFERRLIHCHLRTCRSYINPVTRTSAGQTTISPSELSWRLQQHQRRLLLIAP